ncbi:MAG: LysM peptidoglycan-binding domain-containing protein [Parachlamydia sp.]|nr:LysM peptidoglycan-binding domain-containing protein [Parachlamydia sp.]
MLRLFCVLALLCAANAHAAYNRYGKQEETSATLREVLVALDDLRHEVRNHETEIRTYEEKTRNLEEIIDSLRKQVGDGLQAMRDSLKNHSAALDAKIASQESAAKGLTTNLQSHASDSAAALTDYKKRILDLEKTIDIQSRNIENLQLALKSMTEALQVKDPVQEVSKDVKPTDKVYRVKPGDSLDKIARQNQTTVKKIKELNGLARDQINIGQKLYMPE